MFFHCNQIVKLASWLLWHVRFNSNSKVDVTFPESLQTLTFGDDFDQSLTGVQLPESLRSLTFGGDFNQRLLGTKSLCCKGSALRTSEATKASQISKDTDTQLAFCRWRFPIDIIIIYCTLLKYPSLSHSIHLLLACFFWGGHAITPAGCRFLLSRQPWGFQMLWRIWPLESSSIRAWQRPHCPASCKG